MWCRSHLALLVRHQEQRGVSAGFDPGHDLAVVLPGDVGPVNLYDDVSLLQAGRCCWGLLINSSCNVSPVYRVSLKKGGFTFRGRFEVFRGFKPKKFRRLTPI